jgi:hypothetical protein
MDASVFGMQIGRKFISTLRIGSVRSIPALVVRSVRRHLTGGLISRQKVGSRDFYIMSSDTIILQTKFKKYLAGSINDQIKFLLDYLHPSFVTFDGTACICPGQPLRSLP